MGKEPWYKKLNLLRRQTSNLKMSFSSMKIFLIPLFFGRSGDTFLSDVQHTTRNSFFIARISWTYVYFLSEKANSLQSVEII